MLDSTKENEFVSHAVMKFRVKLRFASILLVLPLELSYFSALLYLKSSKKFSNYYGFSNYIY